MYMVGFWDWVGVHSIKFGIIDLPHVIFRLLRYFPESGLHSLLLVVSKCWNVSSSARVGMCDEKIHLVPLNCTGKFNS